MNGGGRERVLQTAEKFVARGKISQAIREYRKLLRENPNDANMLNRIGDLYARQDKVDEAVALFEKIAQGYSRDGFFVKAIAIYKKIIRLDPTQLDVYERLAELYHRQGLISEARSQYLVLVDYYTKHNDMAATIEVHRKMADLEPNDPSPRVKLAELYLREGLVEETIGEYQRIAELMLDHDRVEEATKVYISALDVDSDDLAFISEAVLRLREEGELEAASRVFEAAVERNPEAAKLAERMREHEEAEAAAQAAAEAARIELEAPAPATEAAPAAPTPEVDPTTGSNLDGSAGGETPPRPTPGPPRSEDSVDVADLLAAEGLAPERQAPERQAPESVRSADRVSDEELEQIMASSDISGLEVTEEGAYVIGLDDVADDGDASEQVDALALEALRMHDEAPEPVSADPDPLAAGFATVEPEEVEIDLAELEAATDTVAGGLTLDSPVGDAPVVDTPVGDSPAAAVPAADGPVADGPVADGPVAEGPVAESPVPAGAVSDQPLPPPPPTVQAPADVPAESVPTSVEALAASLGLSDSLLGMSTPPTGQPAAAGAPPEPTPEVVEAPTVEEPATSEASASTSPPAPPAADPVETELAELLAEADVFARYGLESKALRRLEQALELDSDHFEARRRLVLLQIRRGAEEDVLDSAQRLLDSESLGGGESWEEVFESLSEAGYAIVDGTVRVAAAAEPVDEEPEATAEVPTATEESDEEGLEWLDSEAAPEKGEELFQVEEEFFDMAAEIEKELASESAAALEARTDASVSGDESLEEIVQGFKQGVADVLSADAYETHYNLGIAYREMGLVDEAIGEFQLCAKDPGHLIDSCSMLGACFLEKGFPDLSVKWYKRGLEAPAISEEESLSLMYDLGSVYASSGEREAAYEVFVEIYGVNSHYRDVVARLEELRGG